ncbi:ABC transporter permease [Pollutimonas bauzanensis]|uniref:Transport permease protein n=1 Tax=Pollutimonas bauzanensis TaxID=658167 RepID=A0A1M6BKN3_9BURK|nr:ABC transporter permease [Pollutimonas bauzanensis]SHI49285.1 lipopolysaccharide transport system permease protein [Pollutimonas bauzanensis]
MILTSSRSVWNYRGFILGNVKREFQSKYRNSLLGAAWNVLNPLAMIVVYTVIFAQIMRAKLPGVDSIFGYSIFLCAGVLVWGYFAEIVGRSQNVFIENANILKKINFPRLCLPVVVVANATLNFIIVFSLFTAFLLISGNFPGMAYTALLPVLIIMVMFAVGLGTTLGVLNVFFRDVGQLFGIVLQFWFWLTPIVYHPDILPKVVQSYLRFNPMSAIVAACQNILLHNQWPHWQSLLPVTVLAVLLCIIGLALFRKHAGEMIDEL